MLIQITNRCHMGCKHCMQDASPKGKHMTDETFDANLQQIVKLFSDIEPDCEYYGEPNGCNSPIYGEHPKAQQPTCNAAAMRKALEICAKMGEQIDYQLGSSDESVYAFRQERCLGHNISECARSALSAPPRNCDVGTAEEQSQRFCSFCRPRTEPCDGCACLEASRKGRCEFAWAQMTYAEEGGAAQ